MKKLITLVSLCATMAQCQTVLTIQALPGQRAAVSFTPPVGPESTLERADAVTGPWRVEAVRLGIGSEEIVIVDTTGPAGFFRVSSPRPVPRLEWDYPQVEALKAVTRMAVVPPGKVPRPVKSLVKTLVDAPVVFRVYTRHDGSPSVYSVGETPAKFWNLPPWVSGRSYAFTVTAVSTVDFQESEESDAATYTAP